MAMGAALIVLVTFGLVHTLLFTVHHAAAGSEDAKPVDPVPIDPTEGFVDVPLNNSNFHNLKPYDLEASQRYSFENGVHRFWIYSTDMPLSNGSPTHPRSEVRIEGYYFSTGIWQFEGYGYVPSGTSGVCIMQIFGALTHPTTLMLKVNNGTLTYYLSNVLQENIYDRWFRLNVIYDTEGEVTRTFINGVLMLEAPHRQRSIHHFQYGIYQQENASYYGETRWKGIRVLKKVGDNSQKLPSKKDSIHRKLL
ncbi:citrate-binding protein-like [Malania oleifera]|uniref:citrate-binding protein-like n=1 Tax=Malania oleifera TaxID=397392 RepID=UPI0025AE75D6|nr:citrate-binding protein-like [Malania oleifera]